MNYGIYGRLDLLKSDLNVNSNADDAKYLRLMEAASRGVDKETQRHFYALQGQTRYYEGFRNPLSSRLWVDDLVSVTTVKADLDGDGVYETTLVADTDYWLGRHDENDTASPYVAIDLNPNSDQLTAWPTAKRCVQVVGTFGYSFDTETTGFTVQDNPMLIGATTLTLLTGHGINPGETIVIGTEQLYVSAAPSATALTVIRGVNGSTAAAHAQGVAVSRRVYPNRLMEAVVMEAVRLRWELQTGYGGSSQASEGMGGGSSFGTLYPAIRDRVQPYMRKRVA